MKSILIASVALLAAAPALAQPTPPPPGAPPPAGPGAAPPPPPAMPRPPGPPMGSFGPMIELTGPHGASIKVRCARDESTKACADTVGELLGRVSGMMSATRDTGRTYERDQGRGDQTDDYDRPRRRY